MADAKIESLSPEQEALKVKYRSDYFRRGWSTEPSDRATAEAAIVALYKRVGKPAPKFVWFDSPAAAVACIKESTGAFVELSGTDGCLDSYWACFYSFVGTLKNIYKEDDAKQLAEWDALTASTGPCYPYENYCLMTERPIKATYDDQELLHCADGPALEYKDGFKVYAINGVRIPNGIAEMVVETPWLLTLEMIQNQESADLQAIMQERWCYERKDNAGDHVGAGGGRWLDETGAKSIHEDVYTAYGDTSLMRALLRSKDGKQYLCCSDSSTDRVYYIRVSPNAKTCEEAHMSINGGVKDSDIVASA